MTSTHSFQQNLARQAQPYDDAWWLQEFLATNPPSGAPSAFIRLYIGVQDGEIQIKEYVNQIENLFFDLENFDVQAIFIGHRDSCNVDLHLVSALALYVDAAFLQNHFDYARFVDEKDCPLAMKSEILEEDKLPRSDWKLKARWNSTALPHNIGQQQVHFRQFEDCVSIYFGRKPAGR